MKTAEAEPLATDAAGQGTVYLAQQLRPLTAP